MRIPVPSHDATSASGASPIPSLLPSFPPPRKKPTKTPLPLPIPTSNAADASQRREPRSRYYYLGFFSNCAYFLFGLGDFSLSSPIFLPPSFCFTPPLFVPHPFLACVCVCPTPSLFLSGLNFAAEFRLQTSWHVPRLQRARGAGRAGKKTRKFATKKTKHQPPRGIRGFIFPSTRVFSRVPAPFFTAILRHAEA